MNRESIYLSAIRDRDGTVNVGYLILFRMLRLLVGVVIFMCAVGAFAVYKEQTTATVVAVLGALGTAIGIAAGGMFSTAIAAIAAFLWGDSRANSSSSSVVRTETINIPKGAGIEGSAPGPGG